jgi:protein TonB
MARYYPDRAQRMEVSGKATISCTVTAKGTLESCSVVSENPADMGFGDAALKSVAPVPDEA